jgi:hypothetical protein
LRLPVPIARQDRENGEEAMDKSKKVAIAAVGLLLAVAASVALRHPAPTPAPVQATVQVQPRALSSGVTDAAELHAQLLAEAQQVPEPSLASAVGRVPGQAQAQAVEALNQAQPQASPDAVPLDHQVSIGFTANVIGETDPCG